MNRRDFLLREKAMMNLPLRLLVGTLLFLGCFMTAFAFSSFAQEGAKKDPCEKANETGITTDLVECSQQKLAQADVELNKVYRRLISKLKDKKWELKLRAAQQTWIKYRDTNCDYESQLSGGGSAVTFEYNFCLAEMTAVRAKDLQEMHDKIKERDGK
jgi:uncharacterized protein YecT (DUF1311 family)